MARVSAAGSNPLLSSEADAAIEATDVSRATMSFDPQAADIRILVIDELLSEKSTIGDFAKIRFAGERDSAYTVDKTDGSQSTAMDAVGVSGLTTAASGAKPMSGTLTIGVGSSGYPSMSGPFGRPSDAISHAVYEKEIEPAGIEFESNGANISVKARVYNL
jgi:hypothetical protein